MKINKIIIYYTFTFGAMIIIYLIADFFNIFSFITKELNLETLGILINAIVVVFVFLITYSLVNKKTFEHEQEIKNNKICILDILLKGTYKKCSDVLNIIENEEMLKKYIIPKIDFNNSIDPMIENLKNLPFESEKYIIELFSSGISNEEKTKKYFEIRDLYKKYINMRITFFDIEKCKSTDEQEELYNLLNKEKVILQSKLSNQL